MGLFDLFGRKNWNPKRAEAATHDEPISAGAIAFIDVETPNTRNNRICSIGIIVTDEAGNVVDKRDYLVDPEVPFSRVNMRIHGLSHDDVCGEMTFPQVWSDSLEEIVKSCRIVAHNAPFDLSVLTKTACAYGVELPRMRYACTLDMSSSFPGVTSLKLPDVCESMGLRKPEHHVALSDADACMRIFWNITRREGRIPRFSEYETPTFRANSTLMFEPKLCDKTKKIQKLLETMKHSAEDGVISIEEAMAALSCIEDDPDLSCDESLRPISAKLEEAVLDGWISNEESRELIMEMNALIDPTSTQSSNIEIGGSLFVLTGKFENGSKSAVSKAITDAGGTVAENITKKIDYVVVGTLKCDEYAFGNYGTKVKKALEWKAKGIRIEVIKESDLFAKLGQ